MTIATWLNKDSKLELRPGRITHTRSARGNNSSMPNKIIKAFLSYAHADVELDRLLLDCLAHRLTNEVSGQFPSLNFSIWHDERLRTGDRWDPTIEAAIHSSVIFIVPVSANWLASPYCLKELAIFRESEDPLTDGATNIYGIQFSTIRDTTALLPEQKEAYTFLQSTQIKFGPNGTVFSRLPQSAKYALVNSIADDIAGLVERLKWQKTTTPGRQTKPRLVDSRMRRRSYEFTSTARDFSQFDVVSTAQIALRQNSASGSRVMAQFDFLPRVYIRTDSARIEFGIRRAYLDIAAASSKIERSIFFHENAHPCAYVVRHGAENSVTIELNPQGGERTLAESILPRGPDEGENRLCEVATCATSLPAGDLKAVLTYSLTTEELAIDGVEPGRLDRGVANKLSKILEVAAAKAATRPTKDGCVVRTLSVEDEHS